MAVHVPLSAEAQTEARLLMLSAHNILNPKEGRPVTTPTQDMVLGCYYLTLEKEGAKGEGKVFPDTDEAVTAYELGYLGLHARIFIRAAGFKESEFARRKEYIYTTVGKVIFNEVFPHDFPYMNNADFNDSLPEQTFVPIKGLDPQKLLSSLPRNKAIKKDFLAELIARCYRMYGNTQTAEILDKVKKLGFHYATRAGVTVAVSDIVVPEQKQEILKRAEDKVETTESQFAQGLITANERYDRVIEVWGKAKDEVSGALMTGLDELNPIYMMAHSGARGNESQITQLAGMRGLMADPAGRIIDVPIKANFREGLTVLEYFISTHGARKGLADTALKTADSGYLTRRLVDVVQDVIVREDDCGTGQTIGLSEFLENDETLEDAVNRLIGRYTMEPIYHPETGEVVVEADTLVTEEMAKQIAELNITEVRFRSVLTCKTRHGVCVRCYGRDLASGKIVNVGEAVGIIAAQSIGEPGTQLTMRTFHTGGVAGDDITQGLPRVEELFEARKPKGQSLISEIAGEVDLMETRYKREVRITSEQGDHLYVIPYGSRIKVENGQFVNAGDELTEGSINPHELLKVKGVRGVQLYLLKEVQWVYKMQGVDINDKHIEIIVRQMLKKVKVEDPGDTELLPGGMLDSYVFEGINADVEAAGGSPAVSRPLLLGITKTSLATESFLSAASFQETTRVLTEASIKGRQDQLLGLKENVIIGKLIPAGTGMTRYRNINITPLGLEPEPVEEKPLQVDLGLDTDNTVIAATKDERPERIEEDPEIFED